MTAPALRRSLSLAALVLAAAPLRAGTLKVPGQFESIQAAVDAAVAGDTVLVSKGTYGENVVVTTAGITLKGKSATISGGYTGDCILVQANDVTVDGFTLLNGGGAPLAAAPGDGTPTGGLHVTGTGATITKLTVRACADYGIFLNGTGSVEKCTVDACNGDGIRVDTDDILGTVVTTISKNTVTRCDGGISAVDGPFLVEKNTCELNEGPGLFVSIPALAIEGFPVILATEVSKNEARDNAATGLVVDKESGPALVVEKNVSEHNEAGCQISGFVLEVTSNTFDDNDFGGLFVLASGCSVSKNKVRDNGDVGVFVSSGGLFADGIEGTNVLDQDTVQGNGGDGIRIVSSGNTVSGCTLKDNLGDGVDVDDGATDNAITDDKITGNLHDGIDNSGQLTLISGNTTKDNGGADLGGAGDGPGTVDKTSADNTVGDGSDFSTLGELELGTIVF